MDYKEYLSLQTEEFKSLESSTPGWVEGQKHIIDEWMHSIDRSSYLLDLGCGDGSGLAAFRDKGFTRLVGLELSPVKAEMAKELGFDVICDDYHNLITYPPSTYDVVYSSHSLEHAYNPATVVQGVYRVLAPDGYFICILPYPDYGDGRAHVGKDALGTDRVNNTYEIIRFFELQGFACRRHMFDSRREPEIWLTLQKQ